jgi:hypothetical protein
MQRYATSLNLEHNPLTLTDTVDRQRGVRQKPETPNGKVSSAFCIPAGTRGIKEEAASAGVRCHRLLYDIFTDSLSSRFMMDTVMPLSKAEEGYELFETRKVQKVIFEIDG